MHLIEPNAQQHRAAALVLILIAALTATVIGITWGSSLHGPLLIPVGVAYFLFNGGYVFSVMRACLQTTGTRVGLGAVLLNFAGMLLNPFLGVWTALSLGAAAAALIGAVLLFKEAQRAAS